MIGKIIAVIVSVIIAFLSSFSFSAYALEPELILEKTTTYTNPNKKFFFPPAMKNLPLLDIIQWGLDNCITDAGLKSEITDYYVLYGKERIIGTSSNLTDGLVEMIAYTGDTIEGTDQSYFLILNFTDCGSVDGTYFFYYSTKADRISFGTSGCVIRGTVNQMSVNGIQQPVMSALPRSSQINFNLLGSNTIQTKNISTAYAFPPVYYFLFSDGTYNVNTFTLSTIFSNDSETNADMTLALRQKKVNPFVKITDNIFQAGKKLEQDVYNRYEQNKFQVLYDSIVSNAKTQYYNTYNEFPEYNSNMTNVTNYNNLNTEYSIDYDTLLPIFQAPSVPDVGGGGGVPSDWLGTYPPIDMTPAFTVDNSDMQYLVDNVDVAPLQDSFNLIRYASDFLDELGILRIFITLIVVGIICRFIF